MGEFVEEKFEKLLPLFEQLKHVDILQNEEVQELVKRCRRYEYRLGKQLKNRNDYLVYADYLCDLLQLIAKRRERLSYPHRYREIEGNINKKVGGLLFACALRFKKDLSLWNRCLDFLIEHKVNGMCSRVFTAALQYHSRNTKLRCRSAKWEMTDNHSIDNARSQLQMVLRTQPQEISFWACLFNVELLFAQRMRKRVEFLKKQKENDESEKLAIEEVNDAVLDYKVAEVVLDQALKTVENSESKAEMLYEMCKITWGLGPSVERISTLVYERLQKMTNSGELEYAVLAEAELNCRINEKDLLSTFDHAFEKCPTEKLCRLYLDRCEESENANSLINASKIRQAMIDSNLANIDDIQMVLDSFNKDDETTWKNILKVTEDALKKHFVTSRLWEMHLEARINLLETVAKRSKGDQKEKETIMELFDEAFKKVPLADQLQLWKMAVDFAIEYAPNRVDQIFSQCFLTAHSSVASSMKVMRLDYIAASGNAIKFREEAHRLMDMKPNESPVYSKIVDIELRWETDIDHKLCETALKQSVNENRQSVSAWLDYLKYLLKHKPQDVAKVHQRATLALSGAAAEELVIGWTKLTVGDKE